MIMTVLTEEQQQALLQFAWHEGREWKSALRDAWRTGHYPWHVRATDNNTAYLQQIRNRLGQSWLAKVRLGDLDVAQERRDQVLVPFQSERH